ncbi:transducin beta-like protein 2 [Condylostylus longicornis]|uniref:transducin beta-like protein 2 n=1 Tax=Condylostylus longicornis TaxID=2530218 RepID=UPI00244E13BB|nr:transducin beta-like protein 2 [Condylostylus longicornis]
MKIESHENRTVLIWSTNQLEDAKDRKWFRLNIQYDYGIKLAWSPDSKAIAILKAAENCIEVYKLDRKDGWFSSYERCLTFPKVTDDEIVGFGISCTGRYIITCTNNTDLYIWNLKGSILEKIDTYLMNTYSAKISPCGRFVAACGFAPDCKIWEVKFSRNGEYQKTVRAFDLTGHTSGIYDCAFDQDSSHIATVSKDSSWKLFDIKIEFDKGQLPRCLKTGKYTIGSTDPISALSLNAEVLAIASGNQIQLFSMFTGELDMTIKNVYEGPIAEIMFDPLATISNDAK